MNELVEYMKSYTWSIRERERDREREHIIPYYLPWLLLNECLERFVFHNFFQSFPRLDLSIKVNKRFYPSTLAEILSFLFFCFINIGFILF